MATADPDDTDGLGIGCLVFLVLLCAACVLLGAIFA